MALYRRAARVQAIRTPSRHVPSAGRYATPANFEEPDIRQLTDVLLCNLHETCRATDSDELPLFFYSDLSLKHAERPWA